MRLPKDLTKEEKDPASKYKIAMNAAWLLIQLQLASLQFEMLYLPHTIEIEID